MVTSTVSVLAPLAMVIALLVVLARDIMVRRVVGMTVKVAKCDYYYYYSYDYYCCCHYMFYRNHCRCQPLLLTLTSRTLSAGWSIALATSGFNTPSGIKASSWSPPGLQPNHACIHRCLAPCSRGPHCIDQTLFLAANTDAPGATTAAAATTYHYCYC